MPKTPRLAVAASDGVLDALFGLTWLIAFVTLLSVGLSTLVIGVGFYVLAFTVLGTTWYLRAEGRRAGLVYDIDLPELPQRQTPSTGWLKPLAQAWLELRDPLWWRALSHQLLTSTLGLVTWAGLSIAGIGVAELVSPLIPRSPGSTGSPWPPSLPLVPAIALGAMCIVIAAGTLAFSYGTHRWLTRVLLQVSDKELLRQQLRLTAAQRDGAVRTVDGDRRRIERDLHDGVQPQLVTVGMMLSLAQSKLDSDPNTAKALLAEAHAGTKTAIADLRRLGRGIHPAVLTESGLDAALSALAAQFPFPVSIDADLPTRCRSEIEGAAYFAAAEALTNAAKHSGASACAVRARLCDVNGHEALVIDVADNGHGGAAILPHGGLAGLQDRVVALGGRLSVQSTAAGTAVRAELPCG